MEHVQERWQQLAIDIGETVYRLVNIPSFVGTDDETGYVLMFFNVKNHDGKSTLISSTVDKAELTKLLERAICELNGSSCKIAALCSSLTSTKSLENRGDSPALCSSLVLGTTCHGFEGRNR